MDMADEDDMDELGDDDDNGDDNTDKADGAVSANDVRVLAGADGLMGDVIERGLDTNGVRFVELLSAFGVRGVVALAFFVELVGDAISPGRWMIKSRAARRIRVTGTIWAAAAICISSG